MKYFKTTSYNKVDSNKSKLYAQVSKVGGSTKEILKIKNTFPSLKADKIYNIQKIINSDGKPKPRINITTKSLLRKQVIIPMSNNNKTKFMEGSCTYISNLNRALKNIKSNIMVNFVYQEITDIVIITNKIVSDLKLQIIKRYIKNINSIEDKGVNVPQLPQSKSYLKIIGIPYLREDTNISITSDMVEDIIKKNHIFNNIVLASRL